MTAYGATASVVLVGLYASIDSPSDGDWSALMLDDAWRTAVLVAAVITGSMACGISVINRTSKDAGSPGRAARRQAP